MPFFVVPMLYEYESNKSDSPNPRTVELEVCGNHTLILQARPPSGRLRFDENRKRAVRDPRQTPDFYNRGLELGVSIVRNKRNDYIPCFSSSSSSAKNEGMWTTTPFPIRPTHCGLTIPEPAFVQPPGLESRRQDKDAHSPLGKRWNAKVFHTVCPSAVGTGATIVCPALFPPAHRAHTSAFAARMSTSFPFPSSPHCEPSTTVTVPTKIKAQSKSDPENCRSRKRQLTRPSHDWGLPTTFADNRSLGEDERSGAKERSERSESAMDLKQLGSDNL